MAYEFADGKGPRWVGDALPNLPPELTYAQNLPPVVTDKYVLFFGYDRPEKECCLQQWYPSPFAIPSPDNPREKLHFHTSEQYMMYQKSLLIGDTSTAVKILEADTPAKAKSLGREVKNFKQKLWDAECERIVEEGNFEKFRQNETLKKVLMGTGERVIVETSPNDRVWGIGLNSEEAVGREAEWGQNLLGKCLMRVRERLRSEGGR
ncbi:N-glycosidase [Pseudocercospora fuligena]|uniref:N-glycosidase n=1 Tax=Pseudocercospora fuligena TaxID=685502 RepID=A0A8H6VJL2_9PEZI|nr:N-glycosidase [Pseudocercospora fuligena]